MGGRLFHLHQRCQSSQLLRGRGNCHHLTSRQVSRDYSHDYHMTYDVMVQVDVSPWLHSP